MTAPRAGRVALLLIGCAIGASLARGTSTLRAAGQEPAGSAAGPVVSLEMWGFRFVEPEISLAAPPPDRIVFRLAGGLVRSGHIGGIKTSINGDPAAIACVIGRVAGDYVVTCDLRRNPQFALRPGRNELRVTVDGSTSEGQYVVFLDGSAQDTTPPQTARETRRANDAGDAEPPQLVVPWPVATRQAGPIAGQVSDNRGVASVMVQGQSAALRRPPRETRSNPGVVVFSQDAVLTPDTLQIAVEARDQAGNLTRVLLKATASGGTSGALARSVLSARFTGRKAALIVGVSAYRHPGDGLGDLRFAASDAKAIHELLIDPRRGGFMPSDVETLTNEQATVAAVRDALARLAGRLGPEDLLFVYINAHGSPDPHVRSGNAPFYFLLHDTRLSDLPRTGYPMSAIEQVISGVRFAAGYKVILIDACHGGAVGGVAAGGGAGAVTAASTVATDAAAGSLARRQGVALMTSSAASEVSLEQRGGASGSGVFTLALLEGLRGGADANGDGMITAGELFASVSACVRKLTAGSQNPQTLSGQTLSGHTLPGSNGDLLLASVPTRPAGPAAVPARCGP